ncbi:hypothetical protein PPGU19_086370 (plasmid) [Paraburkholderia sp. PGU19]|nr:hypothetical protein PPGU19_086370 [Paraburkholderia sp. PGU19]
MPFFDLFKEVSAVEQDDANLAPEYHAHEIVEAAKMVHVRVGNKHTRKTHQLVRQQSADIAEIEKNSAAFVAKVHIQTRVAKQVVDKPGFKMGVHGSVRHRHTLPDKQYSRSALPSVMGAAHVRFRHTYAAARPSTG